MLFDIEDHCVSMRSRMLQDLLTSDIEGLCTEIDGSTPQFVLLEEHEEHEDGYLAFLPAVGSGLAGRCVQPPTTTTDPFMAHLCTRLSDLGWRFVPEPSCGGGMWRADERVLRRAVTFLAVTMFDPAVA